MRHRGGDDRTRGHHNRRRRSGDQSGPCRQRAERAESRPGIGRHFAVRTGHYRAKVHIQTGDSPVIICLGPGFTFESTAAEARQLALDLAGALAQLQNGPRTSSRPSWTPSSRSTKQATADHMTSAARRKLLTGRQEAVGTPVPRRRTLQETGSRTSGVGEQPRKSRRMRRRQYAVVTQQNAPP